VFNLNKNNLRLYSVIIACLILLALFINLFKSALNTTLEGPLSLVSLIRKEIGGIVFYHHNMVEAEDLNKEVGFLKNKINILNEVSLENSRLKSALSLKQKSQLKYIAARVIARPADNWSSGLIIDKGAYSGIKKGMGVVTYLGLAGRVVEVTNSTSKIMLISDPSLGVSAAVQRSREEGLVCGTLGSNLIMKYLPEGADIKNQDIIVTSGLNDFYPKGILIGTVVDVGSEFSGLSRYALIKPVVNLSNIEEVLIIIP
jgi:rod shape-determining protein MreC